MSYRIQYRRATAAVATANNVVLAAGEPGLETDTGKVKVGDGITPWNALAYEPSTASVNAAAAAAAAASDPAGSAAAAVVTAGTNADTKIADERVTERANQMNTFARTIYLSAADLASTPAAVIQAAINTATSTGVSVTIAPGTFDLEAPIALKSHVTLRGSGRGITILRPQGQNSALRYNDVSDGASTSIPLTNFHLSDLTIDGQLQSGVFSYVVKGIWIMFIQQSVIERVDTVGTYATGLGLDYPMGAVAVRDCVFTNPGRGGGGNGIGTLMSNQQTGQFNVSDCTVVGAAANGFLIEGVFPGAITPNWGIGAVFSGCLAVSNGYAGFCDANTFGTVFSGCTDIGSAVGFLIGNGDSQDYPSAYGGAVVNCMTYNAVTDGIKFTSPVGTTPTASHYRVANNEVIGAGNIGIHLFAALYDLVGLQVTNNHVRGNNTSDTSNYGGIKFTGASPRVISETQVVGNLIVGNYQNGIRVSCSLTDCVLDNTIINETSGPQANGIQVGNMTLNRVKFGGSIQGHTSNFAYSGTTFTDWTVETPLPGWTRNTGAPTVIAPKGTLYERSDGVSGSLLYINTDGGTTWGVVTPGFGFPATVDPGAIKAGDSLAVLANNALYMRVRDGGTISKIGVRAVISSGNISLGVYANTGSGRSAQPGTQLATTGAIACPAATGYGEVALGSTVTVSPGDWLALSADNATATFTSIGATGSDNNFGLGRQYRQATAHPLPSTPASLVATFGYTVLLVGVA